MSIPDPSSDDRPSFPSDATACYAALASRDARFDGRFFVAVRTTRIYCRPVCRVRLPRPENCRFYGSAAAAEAAGFRPCLRCRPELAPGWAAIDSASRLAQAAARLIDARLHEGELLASVAARLGVSARHLRRLFEAEFGVRPVEYLQTQRLLLAKRLLTDTSMPVTQVAGAAGFRSLRRLNASMQQRYRMSPSALRADNDRRGRVQRASGRVATGLVFHLPVRAPFDWPSLAAFLGSRALDGIESMQPPPPSGGDAAGSPVYARVLVIPEAGGARSGWIRASAPHDATLRLEVADELAPVVAAVIAHARALFDLDADPLPIAQALGPLAAARPGLRVPGAASGFEIAVRAVLGQQVTIKAARTLVARFAARFGRPLSFAAMPELTRAFPAPTDVACATPADIAALGIIGRRAHTLHALARAIAEGGLELTPDAPVAPTMSALLALPGIGDWTAQYIAMRALRWPDAFPAADYGVMKAMGVTTPAQARRAAADWQPWRAYAVMHLWARLADDGPA